MRVIDLYNSKRPVFSIEIFPPKTAEGMEKLKDKLKVFKQYDPDFISVTYGAGGTTRENTHTMASFVKNELNIETVAHLTCVSHTWAEIDNVLEDLKKANIENIMALRGDPPKGSAAFHRVEGGFGYASELIEAIQNKEGFGIGAAGYPEGHVESKTYEVDQSNLLRKIKKGAQFVVSQFFLYNEDFLYWRDFLRKRGCEVPLVAGILPAQSADQITRFAATCKCKVPEGLVAELLLHRDNAESMRKIGLEYAQKQVEKLLREGVDGIHLYALNRIESVQHIAPIIKAAQPK